MIISPIENKPLFTGIWYLQMRPTISQKFWEDFIRPKDWKLTYSSIWLKWHNWIDLAVPNWTPVFAPMDGIVKVKDAWDGWYWLHIKLRNSYKWLEIVLAHLSNTLVSNGKKIYQWDLLWYSGNTWNSTWPHLHFWMRKIEKDNRRRIFDLSVLDYWNWYFGYFDPSSYLITYKGSFGRQSLYKKK